MQREMIFFAVRFFTMSISANIQQLRGVLPTKVTLVAVSKTHPIERIQEAYDAGQRVFGENKVQEWLDKKDQLPSDIQWHLIGHLQSNKVKYVVGQVALIHSVDRWSVLEALQLQAAKLDVHQAILLQVFIAQEETKFGWDEGELERVFSRFENHEFSHLNICGFMGMATNTDDTAIVRAEFRRLNKLFHKWRERWPGLDILSMGMSSDWQLAVDEGSNMIRVGSSIFGSR